ncbi:glycosyltransferase [Patescibacteria group bacterium]|nr:glycosyltransferase [Patescibacteria group bacterium]MCL5409241.1 glycosyltransferase [Patescibacteria group bacterium]
MDLTVHTIVKNEDHFIWFALQSVLPFAAQILVFDTGSSDQTKQIINAINSSKIKFVEKGNVDSQQLAKLRQEQIELTKTPWFLILDGDEIWPQAQLQKLIETAKNSNDNIKALVNRTRNCVGDVWHFLPENAGRYALAGKFGNLNIRLIKTNANLHIEGRYPLESYADQDGPLEKQENNLQFVDCWYLHTSYLRRSSNSKNKSSGSLGRQKIWEKGCVLNPEELPEIFFKKRPEFIANPLVKRSLLYECAALLTTPVLVMKRRFI